MKKLIPVLKAAIWAAGLILGLTSCSKPQERYENPPWLGGSNIETLEGRGNYKIFLELMDSANYRFQITNQLSTLFVPDDEAFTTYFQQIGVSSVAELTREEARQLFTLHILNNPRSRFQLIYEYLWDELQGPDGEYASLFFRKPVKSLSIPVREKVRYFPPQKGKELLMYTDTKLVPLFTKEYFEDFFGAPDGSDYEFMYPGNKWDNNIGMAWHSSQVIEVDVDTPEGKVKKSEIPTASGFIFFIDKVVAPMPSIEEYLRDHQGPGEFGKFYDLMQRFASYGFTKTDKVTKEIMYKKAYSPISNIAEEQGPFPGNETGRKDMFTAFIPNDAVLDEYFKTKFSSFESPDSIPELTLAYIIQTQLSRSLGLISKISKNYFNSYGDPMIINREDVKSAYMCSNGLVYNMNIVLEPNVFTCVPGLLFRDANYSTFMFAVAQAGMTAGLSNADIDVSLFAPSNATLEHNRIRYSKDKETIEYQGADSVWNPMDPLELIMMVQDHIYSGVLSESIINGEGFAEMNSGNFIHFSKGKITGPENEYLDRVVEIEEAIENDKNGILYRINTPILSNLVMGKLIATDPDLSAFSSLMRSTKMLTVKFDRDLQDSIYTISFLTQARYWTGFVPTNAAMNVAQGLGLVPAKDATTKDLALKDFLLYHFVKENAIFDDGLKSGIFETNRSYQSGEEVAYSSLQITNSPNNLSITDFSGKVVPVDHAMANNLVRQGAVHKINSVLKY